MRRRGSRCGRLARPAREAQGRPTTRPILRRQPRAPARSRRTIAGTSPRKPRRLPSALMRSEARFPLSNSTPLRATNQPAPLVHASRPSAFLPPSTFRSLCATHQMIIPTPRRLRAVPGSCTRRAGLSRGCDACPVQSETFVLVIDTTDRSGPLYQFRNARPGQSQSERRWDRRATHRQPWNFQRESWMS